MDSPALGRHSSLEHPCPLLSPLSLSAQAHSALHAEVTGAPYHPTLPTLPTLAGWTPQLWGATAPWNTPVPSSLLSASQPKPTAAPASAIELVVNSIGKVRQGDPGGGEAHLPGGGKQSHFWLLLRDLQKVPDCFYLALEAQPPSPRDGG